MQVVAKHKYLRMSPQKVRLVLPTVRGQRPEVALATLRLMPQAAALPVAKAIKSAVANAENNFLLDPQSLLITKATADVGPTMKRFKAAARGRSAMIRRRSAHVTIIVEDKIAAPAKPKRTTRKPSEAKAPAKPDADINETKQQVSQDPVKQKAPVIPGDQTQKAAAKTAPEVNSGGAQAAPRRTAQQTGRDSNSRGKKG